MVSRAQVLAAVPHHVLDHAARTGQLSRPHPGVYADPARWSELRTRARAALCYAGPEAALSHLTALAVWQLPGGPAPGPAPGPVHVLVPAGIQRRRGGPAIRVHRRRGFTVDGPTVVIRSGLPTSRVEVAVVDSWPLLAADARRAAVIAAVAERRTTPERLRGVADGNLNLPGRLELFRLVSRLELGCRSELELWGYDHVFTGPGLPAIEWNVPVRIGGRTVYLDAYCRSARVNFGLDGGRWHSSARDRERDARRDAALAALGIMVVRFTHAQLTGSPDLMRAQIRAIVAARLRAAR